MHLIKEFVRRLSAWKDLQVYALVRRPSNLAGYRMVMSSATRQFRLQEIYMLLQGVFRRSVEPLPFS